jgi:hypothetical protein
MAIDCLLVKSHDYRNGGAFSFFYSREVLDYCETIWHQHERYDGIVDCMKKFYARLAGKKDYSIMRHDFHIGQFQRNPRCPTFSCPGDCACIGPDHYTEKENNGARYVPHNIDTKVQQLTLLTGAIKLANMARAAQE